MLWTCITPLIKIRPANPKIPVGLTGITNPLNLLEHPKFAVNATFFVRHKLFLHPNSGNLGEVPREKVHIYCAQLATNYLLHQNLNRTVVITAEHFILRHNGFVPV